MQKDIAKKDPQVSDSRVSRRQYNYAKETGLCDGDTYKVLDMMAQQQGIIPKSEKFINLKLIKKGPRKISKNLLNRSVNGEQRKKTQKSLKRRTRASQNQNSECLLIYLFMTEISLKELKDLADDNEIDLSARGLTAVPKALPQVPRLTHVDLGSNKITVLPPSLCTMTRLVRLELGSNQLDHLPDNIGALVHLEHLDLYNNQIEVCSCKKFQYLECVQ
ncbi:leucine Rich repeat-containing domain protein [Cooperia oncophora]